MSILLALLLGLQDPHPLKHRLLEAREGWISEEDAEGRSFLLEHKDLLDWMSRHEYTGLVVRGFVDARHGGEAAAKELARYAKSKGIALLPSVSGREDAQRLLDGFEVDGLHLEPEQELAVGVTKVFDVLRERRKEPLLVYALGLPLWWERSKEERERLKLIPAACVAQWELAPALSSMPSPVPHNLGLIRAGGSTHLRRRQGRGFHPKLEEIRKLAKTACLLGFEGVVVGGAASPKSPDAELALLAAVDFTRDHGLAMDAFLKRHVPRLYGVAAAEEVTRLVLAQPAVHEKAAPFVAAYEGAWPDGDAKEVGAVLAAQLALARSAAGKASADGKRRLDAVAAVLDEQRAICEAAAAGIAEKAKLAEAYEKAGLPDDIYGYKTWK